MEKSHFPQHAKRLKLDENLSNDDNEERTGCQNINTSVSEYTSQQNSAKEICQIGNKSRGNYEESFVAPGREAEKISSIQYITDDCRDNVKEEDLPDELRDRNYLPQGERCANLLTPAEFARFDELILRFMTENKVPGLSIVISQKGNVIYTQCYGFATHDVPLRPDHMFRIASVSKILTAVGVLRLYEGGHLKLSDRVFGPKGLLPEFAPGARGDRRLLKVTVRHLLQHSAGWDREVVGDPVFWRHVGAEMGVPEPVPNDVLIRYMMGQKLQFTPGTKYVYSNLGYVVLGRVIDRVSGQTYEEYIQEILREVGITNIRLGQTFRDQAHPHEVEYFASPAYRCVPSIFPGVGRVQAPYGAYSMEAGQADGGWIATPRDLVHMANCLEGVDKAGRRLLKPATFKLMLERPVYARGATCWYGLGLDVSWSRQAWEHGGHVDGATGCLTHSKDGFTWAVLANYWPADSDYTSLVSYTLAEIPSLTRVQRGSVSGTDFVSRDGKFAVNVKLEEDEFRNIEEMLSKKGYGMLWFDGYQMKNRTFFNIIWTKDATSNVCLPALTRENFRDTVEQQMSSGVHPTHVNSYLSNNDSEEGSNLHFCVIFTKLSDGIASSTIVDHRLPLADLDTKIKHFRELNYAIKCQSIYIDQGDAYAAVLFTKADHNGTSQMQWPRHDLSIEQYEKEFHKQSRYGHLPVYLKCYIDDQSQVKFSCVWEQTGAYLYTAENDMSQYRVLNDLNIVERNNFNPLCLCGYESEGSHKFAVVCVKEAKGKK